MHAGSRDQIRHKTFESLYLNVNLDMEMIINISIAITRLFFCSYLTIITNRAYKESTGKIYRRIAERLRLPTYRGPRFGNNMPI